MSFKYIQKIPSVDEILNELCLSDKLKNLKLQRDQEVTDVFTGKSSKFLLVIGPCSADNENAVCEYVSRLAKLQEKVKDVLVLVPRIYTNKPRTTGEGYKGMAHQPDPNEDPDAVEGIKMIRRMHIRMMSESYLTAADEMLYPSNYPYVQDLLSYVAIGARSVENQEHRLTVSGLDIPTGMKNPMSGDLGVMLNSVNAAQIPHTFIYHDWEVKTEGNPLTHCILRGAVDLHGTNIPNYHYEDLMMLVDLYAKRKLLNPASIIDTSHGNSNKDYRQQPRVAREILHSMAQSDVLKSNIKGMMIESYLVEGKQSVTEGVFGKSITDSCLGWDESNNLVLEIADLYANMI